MVSKTEQIIWVPLRSQLVSKLKDLLSVVVALYWDDITSWKRKWTKLPRIWVVSWWVEVLGETAESDGSRLFATTSGRQPWHHTTCQVSKLTTRLMVEMVEMVKHDGDSISLSLVVIIMETRTMMFCCHEHHYLHYHSHINRPHQCPHYHFRMISSSKSSWSLWWHHRSGQVSTVSHWQGTSPDTNCHPANDHDDTNTNTNINSQTNTNTNTNTR